MKHYKVLLAVLTVLTIVVGCSNKQQEDVKTSMTHLKEDGTVLMTIVEEFDKEQFSEAELKEAVSSEIEEYNSSAAADSAITMLSLDVDSTEAVLEMEFKSLEDYRAYNSIYTYNGEDIVMSIVSQIGDIDLNADMSGVFLVEQLGGGAMKGTELSEIEITDTSKLLKTNKESVLKIDGNVRYTSSNVSVSDGVLKTAADEMNYIIYE